MSVTQSSRGSASGYQVVHRSRDFPWITLGIVSIPLAFFLGWLGSVTDRRPSDPARFARIQVRALTGVGAERGGHN